MTLEERKARALCELAGWEFRYVGGGELVIVRGCISLAMPAEEWKPIAEAVWESRESKRKEPKCTAKTK